MIHLVIAPVSSGFAAACLTAVSVRRCSGASGSVRSRVV